jgi:hypothetical protein
MTQAESNYVRRYIRPIWAKRRRMLSEGASDEELAVYAPYPPARGLDPAIPLPDGPYRPGQRYWPVALPWPFRDTVGIPRLPYPPGPVNDRHIRDAFPQ